MDYLNEHSNTISDESKLRSWQRELMNHFNCKCNNTAYIKSIVEEAYENEYGMKGNHFTQAAECVDRNI